MLRSKWTIVLATVIIVLVALAVLGKKTVHTEIIIEESPQIIWNVLIDEDNYAKWNNLLFPITGNIKLNNTLTYNLVQPDENPIEIKMRVKQLIPSKLLNQKGGVFGIFTYDHYYILEQMGKNTKVAIHEDFRGIAVHFIDLDWIQQAYSDLNQSLREYVIELTYKKN